MRTITLLGLASLAAGCASVDSDLQYTGTLDVQTNGVVLFEDGTAGHAAMSGTTCVVTPDGGVADDVDVDGTDEEQVLDGTRNGGDSTVLARTRGQLHVLMPTDDTFSFEDDVITLDVPDVVDARLSGDDIVALSSCAVSWIDAAGETVSTDLVGTNGCLGMDPAFEIDRADGTAYIATRDGVLAATPQGVTELGAGADLLAFSAAEGALALADAGGTSVRFVGTDGADRWTADVAAPVVDVADLTIRGLVAVMVERDGAGELVLLDSSTGLVDRTFALPGTADIVASANGQTLALVVDDAVHYYNLR